MIAKRIPWIIAALLIVPQPLLALRAEDLLKQSQDVDKRVSYRGLKTVNVYFAHDLTSAAIKVLHLKPNKTRTEYFAPPLLAGIIVIQDGSGVWRYSPSDGRWEKTCGYQPAPDEQIRREAFANYDFSIVGSDKVAGRPVHVVRAIPKRKGEPARTIWLDKEFHLALRTSVETDTGAVVNSSKYTYIEFNPKDISAAAFRIPKTVSKPPQPKDADFGIIKPKYLPDGYKAIGMSRLTVNGRTCVHLQFSNGANTISLFERASDKKSARTSMKSKFTNVLTWAQGGVLFTLIGDLSKSELEKIADSIK